MNYTVDWETEAESQLALIWLAAPDPAVVTRAQAEIDRRLSRNPHGYGRHRSEGIWRIDVTPLSATYTIDDVNRRVVVDGVFLAP